MAFGLFGIVWRSPPGRMWTDRVCLATSNATIWLNALGAGFIVMTRFRGPGLYAAVKGLSTVRMDAELKRRGSKITGDRAGSIRGTAARRPMGGRPPSHRGSLS